MKGVVVVSDGRQSEWTHQQLRGKGEFHRPPQSEPSHVFVIVGYQKIRTTASEEAQHPVNCFLAERMTAAGLRILIAAPPDKGVQEQAGVA